MDVYDSKASTVENSTHSAKTPLVVDLGKHKRRQVRRLRRGRGKLVDRVSEVMDDLRAAGSISESAQPVIVVVQQRRSRRRPRLF